MERKEIMYFYDPNNKSINDLSCWCWHKEDKRPDTTMTLHYFLPNGQVQCFASFGYWTWTNGIDPIEITYTQFIQNVKSFLPNVDESRFA